MDIVFLSSCGFVLPSYYTPCFSYGQASLEDFCLHILPALIENPHNPANALDRLILSGPTFFFDPLGNAFPSVTLNQIIPPVILIVDNRVLLNRLGNLVRGHGLIIHGEWLECKGVEVRFYFFYSLAFIFLL
jgi:hypothetical protein